MHGRVNFSLLLVCSWSCTSLKNLSGVLGTNLMADSGQQEAVVGINLKFGSSGRKKVKVGNANDGPHREIVTGFDGEGIVPANGRVGTVAQPALKVIPTQGNDFRGLNGGTKKRQRYDNQGPSNHLYIVLLV